MLSMRPWLILSKQVDESDLLDFSGQLASLGDYQGYMLANIFELIFFGALSLPISNLYLICLKIYVKN